MNLLHNVGHWLYWNSPTVQATCAILALVGLIFYAVDTRRIREATLAQGDASRRPFFELLVDARYNPPAYSVKNTGVGIAIHIAWRPFHPKDAAPRGLGSAGPGAVVPIGIEGQDTHELLECSEGGGFGIYLLYRDTAGKHYFSLFRLGEHGNIKITTNIGNQTTYIDMTKRKFDKGHNKSWWGGA